MMQGDIIQPTAIHASFAYGPLFRAIDANEKMQQQRLQQMAVQVSIMICLLSAEGRIALSCSKIDVHKGEEAC